MENGLDLNKIRFIAAIFNLPVESHLDCLVEPLLKIF
jgi:hypothetical protein